MIEESAPAQQKVKHSPTILIAADDRIRRQFTLLFSDAPYFVLEAKTQEDVLILARTAHPDLILLADGAENLDAFATCAALHEIEDPARVPVVLLLESEAEDVINRALESGASDFISLPIRAGVMRQRIRFLLRMRDLQADLLEKEERYRIISESISDYAYAFHVLPDARLVTEWSTMAFETITGFSNEELDLLGGWTALIHPDDMEIAVERGKKLLRGEKDVSEFRVLTKTGAVRWIQDTGLPIWDDTENRVTRIYGAAKDITERKHQEEMLKKQAAQLQTRNEELDAFAHTVAHNLKNPIAGMMGTASVALNYYDRMTDEERQENLRGIIEGAYKARAIIESILLLAGVNRRNTVEIGPVDMQEVILSVQNRLNGEIAGRSARITMPDHFPMAVGYAPWIEEVWANYLSNALKYGGSPPQIEFGADPPRNGQVCYWITDNGKGLTPEEQTLVFTPFTRLSQAKVEGHGLGLSVVQRIVQKLGGTVGVESKPGHGARFWFTLPERIMA